MDHPIVLLDLQGHSTSDTKPLMLHTVLFCPVLTWVCQELSGCGAQRFFIVCDETWQAEARQALTDYENTVFFSSAAEAAEAAGEAELLVIPSAVLPVMAYGTSPCYGISAGALREHLNAGAALSAAPETAREALGWLPVTSPAQLGQSVSLCQSMILQRHMEQGVTVLDPSATYVDPRCTIGADTLLLPGTILRGKTSIGCGCEIGPQAMIRDCSIGDHTVVNASQLNESTVGSHTNVGPFAYVRPGSRIGDGVKVGDFVEVKNSVIGNDTKISHLTYVGDSDVGQRVNFGCGTVTVNYDGYEKFRCTIGDDVFLGCNTNLVAPVTVESGAYTAAGSTITKDVPSGDLGIARVRQTNLSGWVARFGKRHHK
ncbi:MAG: glucosamine-1-phosphate N-acetyltransferase [Ruminococcaceae bacterium]|nr:glucosamine-1-phosphate N-acetyltransferase [Oscillospiraceae bacterium]